MLRRSYTSVLKQPAQVTDPIGICHLCRAGQRGFEFEELGTRSPRWLPTFCTQDPFESPRSPLTRLPHPEGMTATLWRYDLWHTLHLGVCKSFVASMVALLSATFEGRSKEKKFELLSQHFLAWCREHGRPPIITKVTKDLIGWDVETTYPMGIWYKGAISTLFCDYLEDVSSGQEFEEDLLNTCRDAIKSLNAFVRGFYRSEAFVDATSAQHFGELGLQFLRRYSYLAKASVDREMFILPHSQTPLPPSHLPPRPS